MCVYTRTYVAKICCCEVCKSKFCLVQVYERSREEEEGDNIRRQAEEEEEGETVQLALTTSFPTRHNAAITWLKQYGTP